MAVDHPEKDMVFLGIGFENTAPTIAATILKVHSENIRNFFVLSFNKLIPPAMEVLLSFGDLKIDGFICPGYVTSIIGANSYTPVVQKHHTPCSDIWF